MKNKKIYPILIIIVLAVFFTMALTSCKDWFGLKKEDAVLDATLGAEVKAAEQAEKEAEKQTEAEELEQIAKEQAEYEAAKEAEEKAGVTEENSFFPNEPVTYIGDLGGLPITLIVNFKNAEVSGSIASPAEEYPDFVITDGKVDLDTLEIVAKSSGIREKDSAGNVIQTMELTISGKVSKDLSIVKGEIIDDLGEGGEFTATR